MASPAEPGSGTSTSAIGDISWDPGQPGSWLRNFRLGEWLTGPVSPLFETWALTAIEERMTATYERWMGYRAPRPLHVVVNGWYYYGFNVIPTNPARMLWVFVRYLVPAFVLRPRRAALLMPPLAHFGVGLAHREWRDDLQPRYRRAVAEAEAALPSADPLQAIRIVEELLGIAGDYFTAITTVGGYAAKAEHALARFYQTELGPRIGGSVLELVSGISDTSSLVAAHAVHGLDWVDPPVGSPLDGQLTSEGELAGATGRAGARDRRAAAETRARTALAAEPRKLARFDALLAEAQSYGRIREEQAAEFTLAWPTLRSAVLRLGAALVQRGCLARAEKVFDLRRDELLDALAVEPSTACREIDILTDERRARRSTQAGLAAPLMLGQLHPMMADLARSIGQALRGDPPAGTGALVGIPASPGVARGRVRIVRGPDEFDHVRPGDVLVSPTTTPAWTPLFGTVVAVVTDTGGLGAHASIVAREYGLPAVVGVEGATTSLTDGQFIEVDGSAGVIRAVDPGISADSG